MILTYNGVDIYPDISLQYCVHETHAERQADSLTLRFNDPKGVWSKWAPTLGDTVAFEDDTSRTGAMYIHQLSPENGLYTIRALSLPVSGKIKRSKSWEAVRFFQLGAEIAARHGLSFKQYGCTDQAYPYMAQTNETDFQFFARLCILEGCQMIIYDGSLIAYSEAHIESEEPSGALSIGSDGVYQYADASDRCYGTAEIVSGRFSGKYKDSRYPADRILRPAEPVRCNSDAEAGRFARGLLRSVNKYAQTGRFSKDLLLGYAAASTVAITTSKAEAWDGTAFITRARHDYVKNKSVLYFRRVILEGY